jgi:Putative prokaryotic signal transducing protein
LERKERARLIPKPLGIRKKNTFF